MTLTIDNRGVIRLGDSTTHGGKVVEVANTSTVDDMRIARIGDTVAQSAGVTTPLWKANPPAWTTISPAARGTERAAEGALQSCRKAFHLGTGYTAI